MKNTIYTILLTIILAAGVVAQDGGFGFEEPSGDPPICRGTVEIDEDGNPVPDDPNCIPDPRVGNPPPPPSESAWYCFWCG